MQLWNAPILTPPLTPHMYLKIGEHSALFSNTIRLGISRQSMGKAVSNKTYDQHFQMGPSSNDVVLRNAYHVLRNIAYILHNI